MSWLWKCACLVLSWAVLAGPAAALPVTLTLVPSSASLLVGQTLSVDVVVDGLTEPAGEIPLEWFDLQLQFDSTRLQFTSLSFGGQLGVSGVQTSTLGPGTPNTSNTVLMGEFSSLTASQLLALQNAPFTLATIQFQALALLGATQLQFINLASDSLGSVSGRELGLGAGLAAPSALSVEIVPEPSAALLLLPALALLGRRAHAARA